MTRHDEMLAEAALGEVRGMTARQTIRRLLELGLLSRRACERQAVRNEVARLEREGTPRCESFEAAARKLCCSYEKVRNLFYEKSKN